MNLMQAESLLPNSSRMSVTQRAKQISKKLFYLFGAVFGAGVFGAFYLLVNLLLRAFKPSIFKSLGALKIFKVWIFNFSCSLTVFALIALIAVSVDIGKTAFNAYMLLPIAACTAFCILIRYYFNLQSNNFWNYVVTPLAIFVVILPILLLLCTERSSYPNIIILYGAVLIPVTAFIEVNVFYPTVNYWKMLPWYILAVLCISYSAVMLLFSKVIFEHGNAINGGFEAVGASVTLSEHVSNPSEGVNVNIDYGSTT